MKNVYLIFILFFGLPVFSQGENDNWYFGNKAAVNFSGTTPVVLNNSQMNTSEACGAVSDSSGSLLFYTDGTTVWNRDHQVMQNGTGLAGDTSSQQLIIVKDPSDPKRYYVFTTAQAISGTSFIAYSIVDMSLGSVGSNGANLGSVVSKNIPVLDNSNHTFVTEAITAVPHADGSSYWILIPKDIYLFTYLLDTNGLSTTPSMSFLSFPFPGLGSIKASPEVDASQGFSHLISVSRWQAGGCRVFSFDNSNGVITPHYLIGVNTVNYFSTEFNRDASVLFLTNYSAQHEVYEIDLVNSQSSVVINQIFSSTNTRVWGIQRNTYGEVYLVTGNNTYLGKIENSNVYGTSYVDLNNIYLGGNTVRLELPQLIPLQTNCVADIVLTAPETNNNYTYHAGNSITMDLNYSISNQNIIMTAANNIVLLPNTEITNGSDYLAIIKNCPAARPSGIRFPVLPVNLSYTLEESNILSNNEISIYPNPVTSQFIIGTDSNEIERWELFDLSGKLILQGESSDGSVESLAKATYILKVSLKNSEVKTHKLIVK